MTRKAIALVLGVLLCAASLYFFHESIQFLLAEDYVSGLLVVFVGLALVRAGVHLTGRSLAGPDAPP